MSVRFLVLVVLLSGAVNAQVAEVAEPLPDEVVAEIRGQAETVRKILRASLGEGQAYENLRALCTEAPARLAGSPGAAKAVAWAKRTMEASGFDEVRLQPVIVPHWERGKTARLEVVEPASARGLSLPITALGGSAGTGKDGVTAELLAVDSLAALRALGDEVKGKVVFFSRPMDRTLVSTGAAYGGAVRQRTRGAAEAAKLGAVGSFCRSMTTLLDDNPHTGVTVFPEGVEPIPAAAVSTLGAERLVKLLDGGKQRVIVKLALDCTIHEDALGYNVIGDYKGREKPEEIIVVGGHLDAWFIGTGAHDDGAGCVHSLEVVRLLHSLELRPRRTIRIVLFANEENGLRGGRAYRDRHVDEMEHHVMALETDSGGFTPRGFRSDGPPAFRRILELAVAPFASIGADRVTGGGGGADISPMRQDGVPLIGFWPDGQRYFDVHHSVLDVIENVNERELELGAACITGLVWTVADLSIPIPRHVVKKPAEAPTTK